MDGGYAFWRLGGDNVDSDDSAGGFGALDCYLGPAAWSVALFKSACHTFYQATELIETYEINNRLSLLEKLVLGVNLRSLATAPSKIETGGALLKA